MATMGAAQEAQGGGGGSGGGSGEGAGALAVPSRTQVPASPPPTYEHVLAENRVAAERAAATAAAVAAAAEEEEKSAPTEDETEAGAEEAEATGGEGAKVEAATTAEAKALEAGEAGAREEEEEEEEAAAARPKPVEIVHKSSKEFYKAVAAQWGIACKMSDHCRCLDCQSRYFDCEFDLNEQEKTDGGLGAGTPMFISEVIHGTACSIL